MSIRTNWATSTAFGRARMPTRRTSRSARTSTPYFLLRRRSQSRAREASSRAGNLRQWLGNYRLGGHRRSVARLPDCERGFDGHQGGNSRPNFDSRPVELASLARDCDQRSPQKCVSMCALSVMYGALHSRPAADVCPIRPDGHPSIPTLRSEPWNRPTSRLAPGRRKEIHDFKLQVFQFTCSCAGSARTSAAARAAPPPAPPTVASV